MEKYLISDLYYSYKIYLIQLLTNFTNHLDKNIISTMYHKIKRNESDRQIIEYLKSFFNNNTLSYTSVKKSEFIAYGWKRLSIHICQTKSFIIT